MIVNKKKKMIINNMQRQKRNWIDKRYKEKGNSLINMINIMIVSKRYR